MLSGENSYAQNTIFKTLISGSTVPVTLTLSGVPGNVSYSLAGGACSPSCQSTLTFTVSPAATPGTYPIVVTGAPLSRTTSFNLVIAPNPITIACASSPAPFALIGESVTWTGVVSGGTQPYAYRWSGTSIPTSPAPSTNPYVKTYSTIGEKIAILTVTDDEGIVSSCAGGLVEIRFNPKFEEF